MNTAAYHYRQAESYLAGAQNMRRSGQVEDAAQLLALAQVHAELAQAEPGRELDLDPAGIEVRRELDLLVAGSGPEECVANVNANPNWLRNHARNALAIAAAIEAAGRA
jgi:hypothetical protein